MKLNIELTEKNCQGVVKILNALLADEFVLGARTRNRHWNLTGPHFHDLHKLAGSDVHEAAAIGGELNDEALDYTRSAK